MLGGNVKQRRWDGFPDIEAANGHMQAFERYFPLGNVASVRVYAMPESKGRSLARHH